MHASKGANMVATRMAQGVMPYEYLVMFLKEKLTVAKQRAKLNP
jgi:hypothetical protein